jgi:hypothetical protein
VQSSTANTVSSSYGNGVGVGSTANAAAVAIPSRGGMVWNGQPIPNLTVPPPPPSPCSTRGSHSRNSSFATGIGPRGGGYGLSVDGGMDLNIPRIGHISRHSAGSGTSFLSQDMYSGHHPSSSVASSANMCSTSSDCRSTIVGSAIGHHNRTFSDDADTTLIKEMRLMSLVDDKTTVSSSIESGSCTSPSSRRRKPSLKDEMKFILKKMVPTPLKKVAMRKNKYNLERSNGCLT